MRQAALPAPHRGVPRIIERPRLTKLLDESAAQTILLVAPAGYGKTTLARQWVARRDDVRWYTARTGSADVAQLAVELAEVLEALAPGLTSYVSQFVRARPSPARQAAEIVDGFAGAAAGIGSATIAIDDYHLIAADETAERFVSDLQQKLGLRLLIASRQRPRWASARLEIYGESLELGPEELALTDSEAMDVLGDAPRNLPALLQQARGWPAVVGLAAQAGADSSSPPEGAASTLYRFFAEELFLATPTKLQEELITLALLPSLSKPFVDSALGLDSQSVIDEAIESGLATQGPDSAELHPLVREYLFTKLRGRDDALQRVNAAFQLSLDGGFWDHAFELIERFEATTLLDPLIERSFKSLLSSGRIATLERIAQFGHAREAEASPLVGLVDAELAFRDGAFSQAESIASRSASRLLNHAFESHAWWIAGMGAQLSFDDPGAARSFERAELVARDDSDLRDALWGLVMASSQSERPHSSDALARIIERKNNSAIDLVRSATAQLHAWRLGVRTHRIDIGQAMYSLDDVEDPRIRTSLLNQYAYNLILWGQYDAGYEVAKAFYEVIKEFHLNWAQPHGEWALAASALGMRRFGVADIWLRKVEQAAERLKYGQLVLNASCVRSRLFLALQKPEEARTALTVDETLPANRAMRGEFLATRALVFAVLGEIEDAVSFCDAARDLTMSVEAHAYASCARAICAQRQDRQHAELVECVEVSEELGVWDAFVTAVRAWPPLLGALVRDSPLRPSVIAALRNSHDYDLARQVGVDLGRRPHYPSTMPTLSPRESEVLELIRQGFTNADIARALFISEATVKVHVRHILEKTGARSRTEAATATQPEV